MQRSQGDRQCAWRAEQNLSFKQAVNSALRRGLNELSRPKARKRFQTTDRYGVMPVGEPGQRLGGVRRGGQRSPVILVDANVLIYATDPRAERHEKARTWLDGQLSGDIRVGLPWESLLAFMCMVTSPRVFDLPVVECRKAPVAKHTASVL